MHILESVYMVNMYYTNNSNYRNMCNMSLNVARLEMWYDMADEQDHKIINCSFKQDIM